MKPMDFITAARCPMIPEQEFGPWTIKRIYHEGIPRRILGTGAQTLLYKIEAATLHLPPGTIVMDDSTPELSRHLPIWMHAAGRVLNTGLGLGCVVRGLLANPDVDHIDVIEIDKKIMRIVGAEFVGNPRVTLHLADALEWPIPNGARWDYAWHDIHHEDELAVLHGKLYRRFRDHVGVQGAWTFPRPAKRIVARREPFLGERRRDRLKRA